MIKMIFFGQIMTKMIGSVETISMCLRGGFLLKEFHPCVVNMNG
jgi:hypothetical protein